mgnify:CR=1 FL=1
MSLPYQGKLIPRAKELRKGATKQENHLWYDFLRGYPMRFQRQKTIDALLRISIVTLQGWLWKWTVHSIMMSRDWHTTKKLRHFCRIWCEGDSVF